MSRTWQLFHSIHKELAPKLEASRHLHQTLDKQEIRGGRHGMTRGDYCFSWASERRPKAIARELNQFNCGYDNSY